MITENYNDYKDGGTHKEFTLSVVGEQTEIGNTNLMSESIKLEEAICSENNLRFGCCEASQFTAQIANEFTSLEGKYVDVSVEMDTAVTKYGTFKIVSDKPTADRIWRVIKGYDKMYDILNADVLTWYNGLTFPITLKAFRDSFFTYLGITQETVTLINDSFQVQQGFSATGSLSGKTIITAICEFNGVFGHINRDGNFDYVSLDSASSFNCPPYENNSVTYEDYVTEAITKVTMRGTANDVGTSVGVDGNEYIITNNPLIYGTEGTQALTTALTNLLNKISQITFRPYSLSKTIGNPCVELGDSITISTRYQTINSYVIKRVLSGIQALRDNYSATGYKVYPKEVNSIQEQINRTQGKMNELSRTVDETVSTVTRVEQIAEDAQETADGLASDVQTANQNAQTALNNSNRAIVTDTIHYLATSQSSGVTTSTSGWTTTTQSVTATNKYLWTYHTYTYGDSHTSDTTPVISGVYGDKGEQGQQGNAGTSVSITSQSVTYQASTNGTTSPTGTWQSSVPTVADNNYLWTRTIVNYSDGTSTTAYSVSRQGQQGQDGKGISNTTVTYQASTSNTTAPTGTWQTSVPSVSAGKYLWTRTVITYTDSTTSTSYSVARQGSNGTSVSISSTSVTYQVSTSGTTAPTGTWQNTPQATSTGQYLWTRTIVNYSNGTSTTSYSVSAHGSTGSPGATGIGISEVTPLYYVSNSSTVPSAPTSQVTTTTTTSYNTWTKGIPAMTTTYKYMFTCDQVKYTNNTFAWTTPVLDNALSTAVSEIKQTADQIVMKVDANGNIVKVALSADPSTGSNVLIKGDNIQLDGNVNITSGFVLNVGTIQSQNYVPYSSGMKISLTDGTYDSPYFKITSDGKVYITGGEINLSNSATTGAELNNHYALSATSDLDTDGYYYYARLYPGRLNLGHVSQQGLYDDMSSINMGIVFSSPGDTFFNMGSNNATRETAHSISMSTTSNSASINIGGAEALGNLLLTASQITLLNTSATQTFRVNVNGTIMSNSLTANRILVSDANKNIVSSNLTTSDLITTGNIGSQSVNYANSAGSAAPTSGSDYYMKVGNSGQINHSGDMTVLDIADQVFSVAMVHHPYDTPTTGWKHIINLGWSTTDKRNAWNTQLLFGTENGDGFWYRIAGARGIAGVNWKRVLDSSNYSSYAFPISGGTLNGIVDSYGIAKFTGGGGNVAFIMADGRLSVVNRANNAYVPVYASAFTVNSSKLVKENIKNISDNEAKKILNLRVVDFDYINGKKNQCGLIAEEVMDILPYCVDIPKDYSEEKAREQIANGELPDVPGIDYSKLVAPLIKLVQIQQRQIDELKVTNAFYQNIINTMQAEIEEIKLAVK